jgi:hypothetical protein
VSTYTQHVTLTPSPYHPDLSDAHSQSYKLWSKESLSVLQSIRLAPNNQQLAVVSNTGPIVNLKMFDENFLTTTHRFNNMQRPDLFPLDSTDQLEQSNLSQRSELQATSAPAQILSDPL